MESATTGYLFDDRFLLHDTGQSLIALPAGGELEPVEHPSAARITRRAHALIAGSGLADGLELLPTRSATTADIELYHEPDYIERIGALCAAGGGQAASAPGESVPVSRESFAVALLAAGSGIAAVDAVMAGAVRNALVLLRPPGHHAMPAEAMGYCIFNNIVIAAIHAQRRLGLERVLIVDWDVHHGNGTQSAFYRDERVVFVSLHQDDWYPLGWGKAEDVGSGTALGRTVNLPLPPATGDRGYIAAFERLVRPIARQFQPDIILVSAGQDAGMVDPHGRMLVSREGFRRMSTIVRELADELCGGKLVLLQEGGYSPAYTPFCVLALLEGLTEARAAVTDPFTGTSELARSQRAFDQVQTDAIDRVVKIQRQFWAL